MALHLGRGGGADAFVLRSGYWGRLSPWYTLPMIQVILKALTNKLLLSWKLNTRMVWKRIKTISTSCRSVLKNVRAIVHVWSNRPPPTLFGNPPFLGRTQQKITKQTKNKLFGIETMYNFWTCGDTIRISNLWTGWFISNSENQPKYCDGRLGSP